MRGIYLALGDSISIDDYTGVRGRSSRASSASTSSISPATATQRKA